MVHLIRFHAPWLLALASAVLLLACSEGDTPQAAYAAYHRGIADGMSFEQETAWYSARNRDYVESRIDALMERTNRSRDEVLAYYLNFTREYARCVEIELMAAKVDGLQAELRYRQSNRCDAEALLPERQIYMVNENGWKIDRMELVQPPAA